MSDWDRYNSENDARGAVYESDYDFRDSSSSEGIRDRARQSVDQMRSGAREATGRARQGFDHYFHEHPLTFAFGALALGLAVGMLLPSTRQENQWMGEASERVKDRTRDSVSKMGDVAKTSFKEARDTAESEFEERGYDAKGLKEGAKDVLHDAREVAEKTGKEARRAAEEEAERNKLR
ncbi:MAG: hypothetical protein WD273_07820 [Trueperaceae bacterium]